MDITIPVIIMVFWVPGLVHIGPKTRVIGYAEKPVYELCFCIYAFMNKNNNILMII